MEKQKLFLDIQFFADEEDDDINEDEFDEEEDEEVEDDDSDSEDEEFDDGDENEDEEETDEEDKKDEEVETKEETKETEKDKKKQSRAENSKFAEMRKEQAKLKAEQEKAREEGRIEGIKQAYNNKNKFTGKVLTDKHSVDTFLTMLEMEEKGLDPIEDYADYIEEKNREKFKESEDKRKQDDFLKKDLEDFIKEYPDVDLNTLVNDEDFELFSEGKIGNMPLANIYKSFIKFQGKYAEKANKEARMKVAKSKSSPGSSSASEDKNDFYTFEQLKNMSDEELEKNWKKVEKSYDRLYKTKK